MPFQDCDNGIPIRYRFDGELFNLRRMQAKNKVQIDMSDELPYVDEIAIAQIKKILYSVETME